MKKIVSILFVSLFIIPICSGQNKNIQAEDFNKLEIFDGIFQHSYDLVFKSYNTGDCFGCWLKPVFEEIILDTISSRLKLTGKLVCENQNNSAPLPSNFFFIVGDIKIDTIKGNKKNILELKVLPNDIFRFYRTNNFEISLRILNSEDILCFSTSDNAENRIGNKSILFFPVDIAHFYCVGKLLNKNK